LFAQYSQTPVNCVCD